MFKKLSIAAAVASTMLLSLSACEISINDDSIKGSGNIITEKREAASFDSISNHSPFDIELVVDGKTSVAVEGDDNFVKEVETIVEGNTLVIRNKKKGRFHFAWKNSPTTVKISTAALVKVLNSGSGDMRLSQIKNEKLEIISEGPGDIQASGSSNELNFHASGSGDVSLRQLSTKKVTLEMQGPGDTEFGEVTQSLKANISGNKLAFRSLALAM